MISHSRRAFALAVALTVPGGVFFTSTVAAAGVVIKRLRCESRANPIGLDEAKPQLGWVLESSRRGERQMAYQVLAARDPKNLLEGKAELWDSGKVDTSEAAHVPYGGKPLAARERVHWKVRVWDKDGKPSPWSAPAFFEMGLLGPSDWEAKWIGLPPDAVKDTPAIDKTLMAWLWCGSGDATAKGPETCQLRATVDLTGKAAIKRALLVITADSEYLASVNGKEAGGGSDPKRFDLLDLTSLMAAGKKNAITVVAKRGGGPGGVAGLLRVELDGGESIQVYSNRQAWRVASEVKGADWTKPDFDDKPWSAAREVASYGDDPWQEPASRPVVAQFTPAEHLRKGFAIAGSVKRARLYATALGVYELSLNGKRVGDFVLAPGWTDYNKRVNYQSYDVTALVKQGDNLLGAIVGDGWYAGKVGWRQRRHHLYGEIPPKLLAQLEIETADGKVTRVVTDESWQGAFGPILMSDLMDGEEYDARKELSGWDRPGFKDDGWKLASVYDEKTRRVVADPGPPVSVIEDIKAKTVTEPKPGIFVYDLGQNMVGWERIKLKGGTGTTVTIRTAEMLNPDGTLYTANLRRARSTDRYTFRGGAEETWEPRFSFHGFRYIELSGVQGKPGLAAVTGRVVHSATPVTGTLVTSNAMLNQLQKNIVWGQKGNFLSIPTDCPQRDERLGWMGDAQIFVGTACLNMDVARFFRKWLRDVVDAQQDDGGFADYSPRVDRVGNGAPAWGDAGVIVPWSIYQCYGDVRTLAENYDAMKRWVDFIKKANPDFLWTKSLGNNFGEWLSIKADTDKNVLATMFFARSADLVARSADVLGKKDEAKIYRELFEAIKVAFNKAHVNATGRIQSDTQATYVLALEFDLLPAALRTPALQRLVEDIENKGWHLSTGFLGVGHILPALAHGGRYDVAYRLLTNDTFPSWGYSIKHGATTIWERWDGFTAEKGFQDPGMNSFNHYSFGSVGQWMFGHIGGIETDPSLPGYKHFNVRPVPGGGLTSAKAELDGVHGKIVSDWKLERGQLKLRVVVPANTSATVRLPSGDKPTEGGKPVDKAPGVSVVKKDAGETVMDVGAGTYQFAVQIKK